RPDSRARYSSPRPYGSFALQKTTPKREPWETKLADAKLPTLEQVPFHWCRSMPQIPLVWSHFLRRKCSRSRSRRIQWWITAVTTKWANMSNRRRPCVHHAAALAGTLVWACAVSAPAFAADVSPWDTGKYWAARLIAGNVDGSNLRAGLEIKLDPGWKTYWRYPGDSGVPPVFDFASSENVKSVTVLWPAPQRFPDGSGG